MCPHDVLYEVEVDFGIHAEVGLNKTSHLFCNQLARSQVETNQLNAMFK